LARSKFMKPLALVIDRDAGTRKLLDVLLTRFGYEVDRVADSGSALALLERIDYDFILSENEQVAQWVATNRSDALQRLMILSSATETQLERMKREWTNVRIVRKPFELADVIEASREAAFNRPQREPMPGELFWRHSIGSGAKSGLLVRRDNDKIQFVTQVGYPPGEPEAWFPLSVNEPYPLCAAIRQGQPVWLASITNAPEYPLLAEVWLTNRTRALAVAPLIRDGIVLGAVGWTFRDPQRFTETEKRTWLAIAEAAAAVVEGDRPAESTSRAGA
jgi:CheY-like chemotaxis protein